MSVPLVIYWYKKIRNMKVKATKLFLFYTTSRFKSQSFFKFKIIFYKCVLLTGIVWLPCKLVIAVWASGCELNFTNAQPGMIKNKKNIRNRMKIAIHSANLFSPPSFSWIKFLKSQPMNAGKPNRLAIVVINK